MKDKNISYLLWAACFVGACGLQRIYNGKLGTGLLYLFTFGLLGIGQLVDLFLIPNMVKEANARLAMEGADPAALYAAGGAAALLAGTKRIPRTTDEFQVALVQAAQENQGKLTIAEAVSSTGRSFKDVKTQLDSMAVNGYIELDSDDEGSMYYKFPGLG